MFYFDRYQQFQQQSQQPQLFGIHQGNNNFSTLVGDQNMYEVSTRLLFNTVEWARNVPFFSGTLLLLFHVYLSCLLKNSYCTLAIFCNMKHEYEKVQILCILINVYQSLKYNLVLLMVCRYFSYEINLIQRLYLVKFSLYLINLQTTNNLIIQKPVNGLVSA